MKAGQPPATKRDVEKAVEELAEVTSRAFANVEKRMATKDDLSKLEQRMGGLEQRMATKDDIKRLDNKFEALDGKVSRIENSQQAVLSVLQDIDANFREQKDVPERVARLERRIFR